MCRVAVIGGKPVPVMHAKELGVDVVLVHEEGKYDPDVIRFCERIVHAPIDDSAAILEVLRPLHEQRPFDRVLSTTEVAGVSTGEVVEALGLPGTSAYTARALKDKGMTRALLAEHGISPVRYRVVHSGEQVERFWREQGGPVVLKPVDGVGSNLVHRIENAVEAETAWAAMRAAGRSQAIVEEYLTGPIISVESFSAGGVHVPIATTEYVLNEHLVEVGFSVPSRLAAPYEDELRKLTMQVLDAVGLQDGPTHTEFVLTADGPKVLESHNRTGGGVVLPELVRRAYGLDILRMFLSVPLGIDELPDRPPEPLGGASLHFFEPEPGAVTGFTGLDGRAEPVKRAVPGSSVPGVSGLPELADAPAGVMVQVHPGDSVPPIRAGWDRRMGYVVASGRDAGDAEETVRRIQSEIVIHTS